MTLELIHEINPSGQRGIWKHSQNVAEDLLKQFVVQVQTLGWVSMKSFDSLFDAVQYMDTLEDSGLFPAKSSIRIWDERNTAIVYHIN